MPDVPVVVDSSGSTGVKTMAATAADIADDAFSFFLENFLETQETLVAESQGNIQSSNSIMRHSASRQLNQVDPIEAACAEMILQLT